MMDRSARMDAFVANTPWAGGQRALLAGDASNRRYERITHPTTGKTAVLMDAPPDKGEDVRPFVTIARHLRDIGLSAPAILEQDAAAGFLLIEDLGDDLFARVLKADPLAEEELYGAATDVLVALHRAPMPPLDAYDAPVMSGLAGLAFSKYRAAVCGPATDDCATTFDAQFQRILKDTTSGPRVLIQRDYHAENLLWLPERSGVRRVGLLDFQDAMSGHPAYDLVSLLQDIRRHVSAGVEETMINRYLAATGFDGDAFRSAYAALGVQRNLRIMGVFARLGTEHGKPHYVDLIPIAWQHVLRDLDHPALAPVADLVRQSMPPPNPENLARLRP